MKDLEQLKKNAILSLELNADTKTQITTASVQKLVTAIKRNLVNGKSLEVVLLEKK